MNRHAPSRWLQLLLIVIAAQLSVTTGVHLEDPSEAEAAISESLSAPGSKELGKTNRGDHSVPTGPVSVIEQSPNVGELSSVGRAKAENGKSRFDKEHVHIDLTGVQRSYRGNASPKFQPQDYEDHKSHPLFRSEQEDVDMFIKSCMIFQNDYIMSSSYAKGSVEEGSGTMVMDLNRYNKQIADMLTRKLTSKDRNQQLAASIQEKHGDPSGEQEQFLRHDWLQATQKKHAIRERVPQIKLNGIVKGLKECLYQMKFQAVSNSEFRGSEAWLEEESIVRMVFQAIEYMYKYNLITPGKMIEFFDKETARIAGRHLAGVQLFELGRGSPQFTPEIEEFKHDWRTYHLHKCLNDLPEDRKGDIIHSAIGTYWKAIESNQPLERSLYMKNDMLKSLFMEAIDPMQIDLWANAAKVLVKEFRTNFQSTRGDPKAYESKLNFYMLDFVLRYSPFKDHISEKAGIDATFILKYFEVKMFYKDSNLLNFAEQCLNNAWKHRENSAESELFTAEQWMSKSKILWQTSQKIKSMMQEPADEILRNHSDLVWLPSLSGFN